MRFLAEMRKVAIVVGSGDPLSGGGHTFVKTIINGLSRVDLDTFKFKICVVVHDHETKELIPSNYPVPVVELRGYGKNRNSYFFNRFKFLIKFRKRRVTKVLNCFDFVFYVGCEVFQTESPYGFVLWDLQHMTDPIFPEVGNLDTWISRDSSSHLSLRRASLVVTGTNTGRDQIMKYYGVDDKHISIIPHPVKYESWTQRSELHHEKQIKTIFYPAQFWPHKNHIALVRATKFLKENGISNFKVVFTGSDKGNKSYILEQIAANGVTNYFEVYGFVSEEHLEEIYDGTDLLVYPSYSGPENLPPLEALARGIPVFISGYPGAWEQLGRNAKYFEPSNHQELAELIRSFLEQSIDFKVNGDELSKLFENRTGKYFAEKLLSTIDKKVQMRETWR
jgi:glycosyltransferase involved in cell wall biosynthesis